MAGDEEVRPVPDPTELTRAAVRESAEFAKSYTDGQVSVLIERLRGIDRATIVLNETVNRVPTDMQKEIGHVRELMEAFRQLTMLQFDSIENWRKEQKADTEKAVQSALSAAKEAVKEQTTASQLSINKSEASTTEQLKQLTVTFNTAIGGQNAILSDVKERIGKQENLKQGGQEKLAGIYAALFAAVAIITIALFLTRSGG